MIQNGIEDILLSNKVIPVATVKNHDDLLAQLEKIQEASISCIEITLRTDYALTAIEKLKNMDLPNFKVGVGTIIRPNQIDQVHALNVDFIVSPGLTEKLAHELSTCGIPYIPGVSTVSEIMQAVEWNCYFLKFFPAHLSGGIEALKAYGQLFPSVVFCPTGGITSSTYTDYLNLTNVASIGGSWMLR